ncbi:peptidyl-prolyl cis-trans isomerase D [Azospirillaceae bacterium]
MLQFMRGAVGSWIVKILFVILIVSFGIWGIGDIFRSHGPVTTVMEIGPVRVSAGEVEREFQQQLARLRTMFGGRLDIEQARSLGLFDQAVQTIIQRTLYDLAAQDHGLVIGDNLIRGRIQSEQAFRNAAGQFDRDMFHRVLTANNLNETAYIALLRGEMTRELIAGAIGFGGSASKTQAADLYRYRQEKRIADFLTIANASMPDPGTPDAAAQVKYHEDHAARFTAPEYRTFSAAWITAEILAKDIEVPEREIRAAYDERADDFQIPEKRNILQVLIDNEEKAKQIVKAAQDNNGDLEAAAKAAGADIMPLDAVAQKELPEIGEPAFKLALNAIGEPVKSQLGWHVMKVTAVQPATNQGYDGVREQILADLKRDRAQDQLPTLSNAIEDALAGGQSPADVAARFKMSIRTLDKIDSTGHGADGQPLTDPPPALADMLATAFSLNRDGRSQFLEGKDGVYYVVNVAEIIPSRLRSLEDVREQITSGWQAEERARRAEAKAKEIVEKLRAGQTIEAAATENGVVSATTDAFIRTPARDAKLPADLIKTLFTLKTDEVAFAPTADGQIIAKLKGIIPVDPNAPDAQVSSVQSSVRRDISSDLMSQFTEAMRQRHSVRIYQSRLQALAQPAKESY